MKNQAQRKGDTQTAKPKSAPKQKPRDDEESILDEEDEESEGGEELDEDEE
jgi:hypothetical protein